MTPILWLVVLLLIAGVVMYMVPMDPQIKSLTIKVIIVIVVITVILWIAQLFHLIGGMPR